MPAKVGSFWSLFLDRPPGRAALSSAPPAGAACRPDRPAPLRSAQGVGRFAA